MASVTLCPPVILQFFNNQGQLNAGGSILTQVGGVNYPTYQDIGGSIPLPNPIPLNSRGEVSNSSGLSCQLFLVNNTVYTFTLFDKNGNQLDQAQSVSQFPFVLTQPAIGQVLYPQTNAELIANVAPTYYWYPEGDIRRYGASTVIADNSIAISNALSVSTAGGAATYIPGGTWPITNSVIAYPGSSMYGAGATNSVIQVANGVDGLQFTTGDSTYGGRTFRDFKILGTLSGTTNNAHGVYMNASAFLLDILFSNVAVIGFQYGFFIQNVEDSTIFACLVQNCYHGIYFNNQSVNVFLIANTVNLVSPTTLITGAGTSSGVSVQGSPEVEGLHVQSNTIYGYNYALLFGLVFEVQICANDISNSSICAIYFTSVIANMNIRDNWIELGPNASGTFNNKNGAGDGNLCGIYITAVAAAAYSKVHIQDNHIVCDNAFIAGSTAVWIGTGNNGILIEGNNLYNFDVGVGGGTVAAPTGSATIGASIKHNQISAQTASILLNTLSSQLDLGPNYNISGGEVQFNAGAPTSMVYSQPNVPMQGRAQFAAATTCVVTFTNPLPTGVIPRVAISGNNAGFCSVSSQSNTGFTINCSVSNSNTVDWQISI